MERLRFWKGKKALVTGHTGFKGAWLTIWLQKLGAKVTGYSLPEYPNDEFYNTTGLSSRINDVRGNVEDYESLAAAFRKQKPDAVFHLAAQSLVRKSYDFPRETFNTNVQGTVNVLECIRRTKSVKTAVIVTSDKCYQNNEWIWGYRENDHKGGHDPYSASKGCAELAVDSYRNSFYKRQGKYVASARAGNVIGGGDWSADRLIPDCVRALEKGQKIRIRSPRSTRPWQHVLEPLDGYLLLAQKMWKERRYDEPWNFGPPLESIRTVAEVADMIIDKWEGGEWVDVSKPGDRHEARSLSLDISKAYLILNWRPSLSLEDAIGLTVEWYKGYRDNDAYELCARQIDEYWRMKKASGKTGRV